MNRLRRLDRRRKMTFRPASIYGQDPGDASVEYSYLKVREEIRLGIMDLRTYPNEGAREKERFLAKAIAPRNRTLRILLIMVFALLGAGKSDAAQPGAEEERE